jgi:vitamin B12 transporter
MTFPKSLPRACLLGLTLLVMPGSAYLIAQPTDGTISPDSSAHVPSRSYSLEEITVTSIRVPSTADRSPAPVSLISRRDIVQSGASALSDVLAMGPGLFIKDYGAGSGIKTVSQRGLGTEHTLVLLNGMPVNSLQTGSLDFGTIAAEEIERVEIVRGGQSASFGANAVAGTVNIVTRAQSNEHLSARMSTGSFGARDISLGIGNTADALQWRLGGGVQHEDGDYPYDFNDGNSFRRLVRLNAQLDALHCSGDFEASLNSTLRLHVMGLYHGSERGIPGIVVSDYTSSRATQRDEQGIVQCGLTHASADGFWWELKLQGAYAYQRYADPDLVVGGIPVNNVFRSTEGRGEVLLHKESGKAHRFTLGLDAVAAEATGTAVSGSPLRRQVGLFVASEHRLSLSTDSLFSISFHPALRLDHVRSIGDVVSPQLGLQLLYAPLEDDATPSLRVHATVGKNFRPPTFNELYYAGGGGRGNPDLRPERSNAYDVGTGGTCAWLGTHTFDVTYFVVEMSDRIIWTTAGSAMTTPKNLRDVVSRGVEVSYEWALPSVGATVSLAYARSRTEKISAEYPGDPNLHTLLPYCPQELVNCAATWGTDLDAGPLRGCTVTVRWARTGFRYTTEDNASFLPAYDLLHAGVSLRLHGWGMSWLLRADLHNLLNASYTVMPGYPMPLRGFRLSVEVSY